METFGNILEKQQSSDFVFEETAANNLISA